MTKSSKKVSVPGLMALNGSVWAFLIYQAFQPGYHSYDTLYQLTTAATGMLDDWHPPILSALWALFSRPVLYAILVGSFVLGVTLFVALLRLRAWPSWGLQTALLIFPTHLGLINTVWKDVFMGLFLLGAVVGLLAGKERRGMLASVPVFLWLALASRHNAVLAVLPLALGWGVRLRGSRRGMAWGLGMLFLLLVSVKFLEARLIQGRHRFPIQQIYLHDLVGISIRAREPLVPVGPVTRNQPYTTLDLERIYSPNDLAMLYVGESARFDRMSDGDEVRKLRAAWWSAIANHPLLYLRNRAAIFKMLLRTPRDQCLVDYDAWKDEPVSGWNRALQAYIHFFSGWPDFHGWLILLVLTGLLFWRPQTDISWLLLASGNLYFWPYFFVGTACDFRMIWWSALALNLALVALMAERMEWKRS